MAGRGRGRGSLTFDTVALGFGKGEALPAAMLQPPLLFPPLEFQPTPLSNTEVDEYFLALKQEFRAGMADSHHYVKRHIKTNDITRYSDKYKTNQNNKVELKIDNAILPNELHAKAIKRAVKVVAVPILTKRKRRRIESTDSTDETTLEVLEKVIEEKVIEDGEDVKEGDEVEEEEEYYEEDEEEENDYLVNHYDEGDDEFAMGDDDDADEGPVY